MELENENLEQQEEKTVDIVIQEYEQKMKQKEENYKKELQALKEENAKVVRAIISGRQSPQIQNPTEEDEDKDFFTEEIEKTKKNLKL